MFRLSKQFDSETIRISHLMNAKSERKRLDVLLVERGLAESRQKGQAMILAVAPKMLHILLHNASETARFS